MPPLNPQLLALRESATVALADQVRRMRAAGRAVIALQTGDPDFPTPAPIVAAAVRAMGKGLTHYCASRGLPELRQAIAEHLRNERGVAYDPDTEILVTCGGIHAYYCALQAVLAPGGEVLVPDPAWMSHVNLVELLSGRAVRVPSRAENGFWPASADWERSVGSRTVALVVNSPNNPTGAIATAEYLQDLVDLARRHDLFVISDEVYDHMLFDDRKHVCLAALPGAKDRTIVVNSFSKTFAMTGWRIGYLAAPANVIAEALKASQYSVTSLPPFVQQAAAFALQDAETAAAVRGMATAYGRRRDRVLQIWRKEAGGLPLPFVPQGAFYFFLDIHGLGLTSAETSRRLLDEAGVAFVPGSVYGTGGEGYLRMTIAAADKEIEAGLRAFLGWVARQERRM